MAFMKWADKCSGKTLHWRKLSNSGDILKFVIPSCIRKYISGQNNYLGKVTSHKIIERKMDNRGSKSDFQTKRLVEKSVKEQRVDGSWRNKFNFKRLRYTLMGFERSYPIKIPF